MLPIFPRFFAASLLGFIVLRLVFWFNTFPNPDEAYYWLWGQHPALSYYDHPPFHAWVQGLFTTVLGRSEFTLRLPNLISNGLFFYTYYRITRYLYGKKGWDAFWLVVLLVLASPLYFLFLALAWHDHWLIAFSLMGLWLFITFADGFGADGRGESWRLYGAGVAIALALLCKYNAVFVLMGLLAAMIADKRLRPLLRDGRLYRAGAIVASAMLPILLWNISNDWQSFHYYVNRSVNTGSFSLRLDSCLGFVLFSALMLSPINCFGWFQVLKRPPHLPRQSVYPAVAFWVFAVSTVILTGISLISAALYYWNITAYLLLFPLLPSVFLKDQELGFESSQESEVNVIGSTNEVGGNDVERSQESTSTGHAGRRQKARGKFLIGGQILGLLFAALLVVHYSFLPLSALASKDGDPDSRMLFGWDEVAAVVKTATAELKSRTNQQEPLLITTDYRSASALAYQLKDKNVTAVSERIDQFDFWFSQNSGGKDAVILADDWHPIQPELLALFTQISETQTVPVTRFGVWIKNYYVTRCATSLKTPPQSPPGIPEKPLPETERGTRKLFLLPLPL